jgi:hypothetical protein
VGRGGVNEESKEGEYGTLKSVEITIREMQ